MKTINAVLMLTSLNAFAFETGMGPNGPWTKGPLGYTDILVSSQASTVASYGTNVLSATTTHLKVIAVAIENDSQDYFQNGQMSVLLAGYVEKVLEQDQELSIDEAVSIVLEFAHLHSI